MAIEYITSKNLFYLICDTLKLMDESLIKHGTRVSYIMSKMLECKGGYEKFEIADFMLLGVLHDIGAYKTIMCANSLHMKQRTRCLIQFMDISF